MEQNFVRVLSDDEIIALYWERNESAIKHTDIKYRAYLLTVAQNILRDLQDCEECLNDTYLSTWNAIPPQRPYLLKAFLASIMRNHALMISRKQKTQKRVVQSQALSLSELEDIFADATDTDDACALANIIDTYLASLDKDAKYVFISRYYFGKQIEQIAKEMCVSRSKVDKRIAYIKQTLKQTLAKEGIVL